ncbi:hypothetical protein B0O80DRAFT_254652 [Mortierella sp. GBAus27b]|nr:hypothetical protein B0O80DRAFT_254652 [Mortierella sp. GBAus27b]
MAIVYPDRVAYLYHPGPRFIESQMSTNSCSLESMLSRSTTATTSTTTSTATATTSTSASTTTSRTTSFESSRSPSTRILVASHTNSMSRMSTVIPEQVMHSGVFVPVIGTLTPAFTLMTTRPGPIIRSGYYETANSFPTTIGHQPPASDPPVSRPTPTAIVSEPSIQDPTAPSNASVGTMNGQLTTTLMTEQGQVDNLRPDILQPPLNRLRSQGPPPYINTPAEGTPPPPQLPPEYASAVGGASTQ